MIPPIKKVLMSKDLAPPLKGILAALGEACEAATAAGCSTDEVISTAVLALVILAHQQGLDPMSQLAECVRMCAEANSHLAPSGTSCPKERARGDA